MKKPMLGAIFLVTAVARADLADYIARPEPEFRWEKRGQTEMPEGTVYDLHLVSQVWHEIRWEHRLQVFRPKKVEFAHTPILLITGSASSEKQIDYGLRIANASGAVFAILYDVPNQPLFDGLKEDGLIAHTFQKTLETKDATWPLLLPMTKAAVKAMDAVQAFAQQEWKEKVEGFVVTGASKRGWTTWLTAAADPRVRAIAPMVFDNLNVAKQMPHQIETFGQYSEKIDDFTRRNLQEKLSTDEGAQLGKLVDPYTYRDRLKLPKLILNGSNDRYWALDALNFYWDDLLGEKYVLYVPNSGHNLQDDRRRSAASSIAFYRHVVGGERFPKLSWQHTDADGKLRLRVSSNIVPKEAVVWISRSEVKDFRDATWESSAMQREGDAFVSEITKPEKGYLAIFGELTFEMNGQPYYLSTQIQIGGKK